MGQHSFADSGPASSLFDEALHEADFFKWLLSEQSQHDVGPWGRAEWVRRYWNAFVRWKRVEHLSGRRKYVEFDEDCFGVLRDFRHADPQAIEFVIRQVTEENWENLDFFSRLPAESYCRLQLLKVLSVVGINSLRINPPSWGAAA